MNNWIHCSQQEPEESVEVIVYDPIRKKVQSGVMLEKGYPIHMGRVFVDFNEEYYKVTNVELWMPLPNPPEGM